MTLRDYIESFDPSDPTISQPYIIAEAGVNHEGSMDLAKRLIEEAKEGGADAIKFQTYKAETIAVKESPSYWDLSKEATTSQFQLFKKYDKFWKNEYETLKIYCDQFGIEFLSTPFDTKSADFLNDLMGVFKISSSDITNKPFIEYLCDFKKPILLSTGAANMDEITQATDWINKKGNTLSLMHCILNYPTENQNANLGMIIDLKKQFPSLMIGYSDHTLPEDMETLEIATLLGAKILEKHFTFDKTLPGNDHYHSMDKEDLKGFIKSVELILGKTGSFVKKPLPSENLSRQNARRSLVTATNLEKGTIINHKHLTWKRPASGISPVEIDSVIGKMAKEDIQEDTILTWDLIG